MKMLDWELCAEGKRGRYTIFESGNGQYAVRLKHWQLDPEIIARSMSLEDAKLFCQYHEEKHEENYQEKRPLQSEGLYYGLDMLPRVTATTREEPQVKLAYVPAINKQGEIIQAPIYVLTNKQDETRDND